jgi:hypothetical protein
MILQSDNGWASPTDQSILPLFIGFLHQSSEALRVHDIPSIEVAHTYQKSIADKLTGAEEKVLRGQIQSMNVKLDKQKEVNDRILDELQALKSLLLNQLANPSYTFHRV